MPSLFDPIKVGESPLFHRIVVAPLTRYRANAEHVHGDLAVEYYSQRASTPGTLLITEATFISPRASGYTNVPGIYTAAQIAAWKRVTDAVHARGCFIYCQLWATGRAAQKDVLNAEAPAGEDWFASASAIAIQGGDVPRELSEEEIWEIVGDYKQAAKNAIEAGFDGVEIHAANGYLIDQFTQDVSNKRTDSWGGSIPARSRFALEVTKAITSIIPHSRVSIRLSPFSPFQSMKMSNPIPQFSHLISNLKSFSLAYIHLVESRVSGSGDANGNEKLDFALNILGTEHAVLVAGGLTPDSAKRAVEEEYKEYNVLVVFGRYFISNPDLVYRVRKGLPLASWDRSTFYVKESERGYTDYPFSEEFLREKGGVEAPRL